MIKNAVRPESTCTVVAVVRPVPNAVHIVSKKKDNEINPHQLKTRLNQFHPTQPPQTTQPDHQPPDPVPVRKKMFPISIPHEEYLVGLVVDESNQLLSWS